MVARVVNIEQESASIASKSTQQSIVVRYLQRPDAGRAALAFGLNGRFNDEQVEDGSDDETFEWTDVLTRQWCVINYKKIYVVIKQVRRSVTVRWEDKACPGSISMVNGCDVDQGSGSGGERCSIGGKEWSVITPLIRLYTASGYCLPKGW